jgi:hypothetical protein
MSLRRRVMPSEGKRLLQIELPRDLDRALKQYAETVRQPAPEVALELLAEGLKARRKGQRDEELYRYALQNAGKTDLEEDLEQAGLEALTRSDE